MKYVLFVSAIFFAAMASAEIEINSISGMQTVHLFKNKVKSIDVDLASSQKLQFDFISTDKIGTPRFVCADSIFGTVIAAGAIATTQANVAVSIAASTNHLNMISGESYAFGVGIDGNNDGDLLDSEDDVEYIQIKAL